MTTDATPSNAELSRRMDDLRSEFRSSMDSLNKRLDRMPTSELLTAYLAKSDTEIATVREDVAEIKAELPLIEKRITEAKRWAIGALISGAGLLVAAIGLARSFAG